MKPRSLTQSGSVFLDVVRFGAALTVFAGHLGILIPSTARFVHLAHLAVCIFFILSGFIIRMVVTTRETTLREFMIDRASRIYSVVLPALLLTFFSAAIGAWFNPSGHNVGLVMGSWSHVPLQIFTNLSFTAEVWGYESVPLFNSPFWSLSFECTYYVLFALMFFEWDRRPMRVVFFLLLLLAGPAIVFLFPIWLLGCLLYDAYIWLSEKKSSWIWVSLLAFLVFASALWKRKLIAHILAITDMAHRTAWLQQALPPMLQKIFSDASGIVPWFARASFSFYIAGVLFSIGILWILIILDLVCPTIPRPLSATIRWIAEGTFALYLLHLPLLLIILNLTDGHPRWPWMTAAAVGSMCVLVSGLLDRWKKGMRRWLHAVFPEKREVPLLSR